MTACKYETFKRTAHPSQRRTNVMFCGCVHCVVARDMQRRKIGPRPGDRRNIRDRYAALTWTPPTPPPETEPAT